MSYTELRALRGGEVLVDRFGVLYRLLAPIQSNYAWVIQLHGGTPTSVDCDVALFRDGSGYATLR